jgi:lysylphosphatidylglycerol synthetase-like protein (DUF2156 family)/UDP-2,3-diacylglucosamine pyrophosphatase LpxH
LTPDSLEIPVPVGGRVLVVSDLHLGKEATTASTLATTEVAQAVESWTGPGVVVLAGDCFQADPAAALAAHPKLAATLKALCVNAGRRVVCLPGIRDRALGFDDRVQRTVAESISAEVAIAVDLMIDTGTGTRRVRVEHGTRFDPFYASADPRNPAESPLGQHVIEEIVPGIKANAESDGWLDGIDELDDPAVFPRFIASRLAYRRLGRLVGWLGAVALLALVLELPVTWGVTHITGDTREDVIAWVHRVLVGGAAAVVVLVLVAAVAALVLRRTWSALSSVSVRAAVDDANQPARDAARELVTGGLAGLITGHTHHAELVDLGAGFYANSGCGTEVVDESPPRLRSLGLPPVFLAHRQVSWVELEAGADLHVRLLHARIDLPGATLLERLASSRQPATESHPTVVASFPNGESWPTVADDAPRLRRIRRWGAAYIALAGLIDLVSSFTPPLRHRLAHLLPLVPLAVPRTAAALVALAGLGLLLLARSVRRGQRHAWQIAVVLLGGSALLHLVKGVDLEEAIIALGGLAYLVVNREAFGGSVDQPSLRRGMLALAGGGALAIGLGTAVVEYDTRFRHRGLIRRLPLGRALAAVAERMVGITTIAIPRRLDLFLTPALVAVAVGLAGFAGWLASRPVVHRRHVTTEGAARARDIVTRFGQGTLDYFALRADKQFFFSGDSVVAYGVYGGVCLVSPDPIGPPAERDVVWDEFRRFVDQQGWTLAVMGAGEDWLPVYRGSGMHDLYVGDEAVVDITRFSLEGGRNKGLRQAVNRIAKYGYTITFHDPATVSPELRAGLEAVMTKSRRGDVERGFSMTLGRIFDPADKGLLLAVVHGSGDGAEPVAFCQYVPAPGINGYSLDLMRRDDGEHPNGLIDFAVVETIRHLQANGQRGLGLNFATMRAVLAGESGDGLAQRVERWALKRMSDSMQIESLWRFNAKFDPDWQPRYAIYDSPEHLLPAAMAVARAESFWELPIIGRFLVPAASTSTSPSSSGSIDAKPAS